MQTSSKLLFALLWFGLGGCAAAPRATDSAAASADASAGGEIAAQHSAQHSVQQAAQRPERRQREPNVIERARRRDAVVIRTRPQDNPRFDPAIGTLLQIEPPTASLPGIR